MRSEAANLPVTFYPSKTKAIGLLFGSLAFVVAGIFIVAKGQVALGYSGICFFGLGIPVALLMLNRKAAYLRLELDGFTVCSLYRAHKTPWSDVERFEVARIVLNKMIVWNFSLAHREHHTAKAFAKSIAGHEAALPDTYGFKAEDLCKLLNEIRTRETKR